MISNEMAGFIDEFAIFEDNVQVAEGNERMGRYYAGICPSVHDGYILYEGDNVDDNVVLSGFKLPQAKVNHEYTSDGNSVYVSGEHSNWNYTIVETEDTTGLPQGMSMNSDGRIGGTPVEGGAFTFKVMASRVSQAEEGDVSISGGNYDYGTYTLIVAPDDGPEILIAQESLDQFKRFYFGNTVELKVTTPLYQGNAVATPFESGNEGQGGMTALGVAPYSGVGKMTWKVTRGSNLVDVSRNSDGNVTVTGKGVGDVVIELQYPADSNYTVSPVYYLNLTVLPGDLVFEADSFRFRQGAKALPEGVGTLYLSGMSILVEDYPEKAAVEGRIGTDGRMMIKAMNQEVPAEISAFLNYYGIPVPAVSVPAAISSYTEASPVGSYPIVIGPVEFRSDSPIKNSYGIAYRHGIVQIERRDVITGDYEIQYMDGTAAQASGLGWYNRPVQIVPAGEYNLISQDGVNWTEKLVFDQEQNRQETVYLKNAADDTRSTRAVFGIRIDMTKPTLTVSSDKTLYFDTYEGNAITVDKGIFGAVYKEDFTLTPMADDGNENGSSGVSYLQYLYTGIGEEVTEENAGNYTWVSLPKGENVSVAAAGNPMGIVWFRAVDFADNYSAPAAHGYEVQEAKKGAYLIDGKAPEIVVTTDESYLQGWHQFAQGLPLVGAVISDDVSGIGTIEYEASFEDQSGTLVSYEENGSGRHTLFDGGTLRQVSEIVARQEVNVDLNRLFGEGEALLTKNGTYRVTFYVRDHGGNTAVTAVTLKKDDTVPEVTLRADEASIAINEKNDELDSAGSREAVDWHKTETLTVTIENYDTIKGLSGVKSVSLLKYAMNEGDETYAQTAVKTSYQLGKIYDRDGKITGETGSDQTVVIEIDESGRYEALVETNALLTEGKTGYPNIYNTIDENSTYTAKWIDNVTPVLAVTGVLADGGAYTTGQAVSQNVTLTAGFAKDSLAPRSISWLYLYDRDGNPMEVQLPEGTPRPEGQPTNAVRLDRQTRSFTLPEFTVEENSSGIFTYRYEIVGDKGDGYSSGSQTHTVWIDKNKPVITSVTLNGNNLIDNLLSKATFGMFFNEAQIVVALEQLDPTPEGGDTNDLQKLSVSFYNEANQLVYENESIVFGTYESYHKGNTASFSIPRDSVQDFAGTLKITAYDMAGNQSEDKKTNQEFIVDNTAPEFTLDSTAQTVWSGKDVRVAITGLKDKGLYQTGVSRLVFWVADDAKAQDGAQNPEEAREPDNAKVISLRRDMTEEELAQATGAGKWDTTVIDSGKIDENGNLIGDFFNQEGEKIGSDGNLLFKKNGEYTIFVRLYDQAGNYTTKYSSYKKDDTLPAITGIRMLGRDGGERTVGGENYIGRTGEAGEPQITRDESGEVVSAQVHSGSFAVWDDPERFGLTELFANLDDSLLLGLEYQDITGKGTPQTKGSISPYRLSLEKVSDQGTKTVSMTIPKHSDGYEVALNTLYEALNEQGDADVNGTYTLTVTAADGNGAGATAQLDLDRHIDMTAPRTPEIANKAVFAGKTDGLEAWFNNETLIPLFVGYDNTDVPVGTQGATEQLEYAIFRNPSYKQDESAYIHAGTLTESQLGTFKAVPEEWRETSGAVPEGFGVTRVDYDHFYRIPVGEFDEDGVYTVIFRVTDTSGQTGEMEEVLVYKDMTPPQVESVDFFKDANGLAKAEAYKQQLVTNYNGKYNDYSKFADVVYAGDTSSDNICPPEYLTVYYQLLAADAPVPADGGREGTGWSPAAWNETIRREDNTEGKIAFYAVDRAGNISQVMVSLLYRVDTTMPDPFTLSAFRGGSPVALEELKQWVTQTTLFVMEETKDGASEPDQQATTRIDKFQYAYVLEGKDSGYLDFSPAAGLDDLERQLEFDENGKAVLRFRAVSYTGVVRDYNKEITVARDATQPSLQIANPSGNKGACPPAGRRLRRPSEPQAGGEKQGKRSQGCGQYAYRRSGGRRSLHGRRADLSIPADAGFRRHG